jgi:hypothetical protein
LVTNGELFFPSQSFVADFASTSREDVFSAPDKVQLLNQVICQHFYRQGMLDIADELAQVNADACAHCHGIHQ